MEEILRKYEVEWEDTDLKKIIQQIIVKHDHLYNITVLKKLFSLLDLTSLHTDDNDKSIINVVDSINDFHINNPDMKNVAAICVYPDFVALVKKYLQQPEVKIAAVAGGFPHSHTYIQVKIEEIRWLFEDGGVDEIDTVLPMTYFFNKQYDQAKKDISIMKQALGKRHLKVILETGLHKSLKDIIAASLISMEGGADFIKTSTGKITPAATKEAVYAMCFAIKAFYKATDVKVGIKPAGGISSPVQAVEYYSIVKEILGHEWLTPDLFRIGASKLANNLLLEIKSLEKKK